MDLEAIDRVDMDADRVDGTPAMMMPPAAALRDAFNAADRDQADHNVDAIARLWWRIASVPRPWWLAATASRMARLISRRAIMSSEGATAGALEG